MLVFRREVDALGAPIPPGTWQQIGMTCFPELVPGNRSLSLGDILRAFHDTDFALPHLRIEPRHNVTLVHLPTYFELSWPEVGFQPGEVDTPDPATLLGYHVEIKPVLRDIVYHFGPDAESAPTTSLGGPYPTGDVTWTYPRSGTYRVWAEVRYTGQFRVGSGAWMDIPGEVTVSGPTQTLTVMRATNRLYGGS